MATEGGGAPTRIHSLDGLRGVLMLLGIPYHAALAFSLESWLISSAELSVSLEVLAEVLHVWRMPTFFIIAGFFAVLMLRRMGTRGWLRGRFQRLGVPLLFGVMVLSPLQWVVVGLSRTGAWSGAFEFAATRVWPPNNWWTIHLWFLVELLVYCVVLAVVAVSPVRTRLGRMVRGVRWLTTRPLVSLIAALVVSAAFVTAGLALWEQWRLFDLTSGLVSRHLVIYAPAFVIGCVLGLSMQHLRVFVSLPLAPVAALAGAGIAVVLTARVAFDAEVPAVSLVAGIAAAVLAFRVAERMFARPSRTVRWLVDASLPMYLLHQPFVVLFGAIAIALGVSGWVGWAAVVVSAFVASALGYELLNTNAVTRLLSTGARRRGASVFAGPWRLSAVRAPTDARRWGSAHRSSPAAVRGDR